MFVEEVIGLQTCPPLQTGKLRGLRPHLDANIRGQPHVMERTTSVLTRGELGLAHPGRPKGSFLFVGPTGVGKTELTNVFTAYLFAGRKPIRFDMSEYQNQSSVEKLIGQESDETGLLGRALNGATEGTLLFDEIEKAHPLVLDLFLQILDAARITLSSGETMSAANLYVVFTSNLGAVEAMRMERSGRTGVERAVLRRVAQHLRPELVARIEEKVVFARLNADAQREICALLVARETARLRGLGHDFVVTREALEFLLREGFDPLLGARPLRATVERHLQKVVVQNLFTHGSANGRLVMEPHQRTGLALLR